MKSIVSSRPSPINSKMSSRSLTKTAPTSGFLSATTSLKFTQVMCTAFSIGMLFFPLKMMEGEHAFTSSHVAALR